MPTADSFETLAAIAAADERIRARDQAGAVAVLEQAIRADAARTDSAPPARNLYIRLAALYRGAERYLDEVALLEGYLARYPDDGQRTRFHSRLSKLQAIIGAGRTSSVVPVNHTSTARPRRSRVDKRLLDHQRRLEKAEALPPDDSARLRARAAALIARTAAALEQTTKATEYQAHLLAVVTENRIALRTLMEEYGAELARRRVSRADASGLVRGLVPATAGASAAEQAVIAAEAEHWCLASYDAAA